MTHDPRGFAYPLDPVHQRARHGAERALERLAGTQHALRQQQRTHELLERACREAALRSRPSARGAIEPLYALACAEHLLTLQARLAAAAAELESARAQAGAAQQHADASNVELRKYEEHRQACLAEYGQETARREQVAADQDWLARRSWRLMAAGRESGARREETS